MKKITRLTESDLTRIVKKVLEEQKKEVLNIIVKLENIKDGQSRKGLPDGMLDLVLSGKSNRGCYYEGTRRGVTSPFVGRFVFTCPNIRPELRTSIRFEAKPNVGPNDRYEYLSDYKISEKASELLNKNCGCSSYVSNTTSNNSNYV